MKIHFYLRFHTKFGQSILVTGNTALLGNNNTSDAWHLTYLNEDFWHGTVEIDPGEVSKLRYKYIWKQEDGNEIIEGGEDNVIDVSKSGINEIQVIDTWNYGGEYENLFYLDPFQLILLKDNATEGKTKSPKKFTHIFKVKAPLLKKNEVVCIAGQGRVLDDWNTDSPVLLNRENGWWSVKLNLPREDFPLRYKYGVYNIKEKVFKQFEDGSNRVLYSDAKFEKVTLLHDGFIHLPNNTWKGAGISIPVFSLRTKNSFGVGEFTDLQLLVDWAAKTGMKVIQVLPVNDTIATNTWLDSYPYAAISAFALHPIYLNIEKVAGKKYSDLLKPLKKKQKQLNELKEVNYEEVLKLKLTAARELFILQKEVFLNDKNFLKFFESNKHWLGPYAAFCYLRDRNRTTDFKKWKLYSEYDKASIERYLSPKARHYYEIAFHYFLQYHLNIQLKKAAEYAHENGIILKGDIPIGIYRYGCDAWMDPDLYHMDVQAGAPPDDFAQKGQNWGFPTYNWDRMAKDGFEWWKKRFVQMSSCFDAFRIDHILGFFRIWCIPIHSVEGIMGFFVPAMPIHKNEFVERGIYFDHDRYCNPFITDSVLWQLFGPNTEKFKPFLKRQYNGQYTIKEQYATQQQVADYFTGLEVSEENDKIKQGLFDLLSNVILFRDDQSTDQYHFRISMENTTSFTHLDGHTKNQLRNLYVDYFYKRQDDFWKKEGMKKLPPLKRSTNMLICGEDLGMVPHCVPDVMNQLGILSLEIQRMPKEPGKEFFNPVNARYLSVVSPSTHDMSTIRSWWEEDRNKTQRFFNQELGQWGEAPPTCEAWISKRIINQHLHSPAMWSIFLLQDILGMSGSVRRENPHEERINIPADPNHYWKYRMHLTLEQLMKEKEFNAELKDYVESSGR